MSAFNPYESLVLRKLLGTRYESAQIESVIKDARLVSLKHTGVGYFLTVAHPLMPTAKTVVHDPPIYGRFQDVLCGFLLFLEQGELMLECFSYPTCENLDGVVPESIREKPVAISEASE